MYGKIQVPEASKEFDAWLFDRLQIDLDFYNTLNYIAGVAQTVEIAVDFNGSGGAIKYEEHLEKSTDKVPMIEIKKLVDQGYTAGDVMHIYQDAYLKVRGNMVLAGLVEGDTQ